ncbi:TonB-dependent receptor plug domain-containing protein [Profundibacter sp.]
MKHLSVTASAIAIACAQPALAEERFDLGNITVFANKSGLETDLDRTGATVEIITQEDLEQAGETSVAEYLARLPGLSASANGGLGTSSTLRVRGLDGKYIKVLVDGIDVTDPGSTQTQFNWGGLTTSNISRIEVLKGSSSSIYGSRAIAGVVNITTVQRDGEPGTNVTLDAEGGSFGTYRGNATVTTQGERGGLSFSLSRVQTDGFSARDGVANTEDDGYEATQLNFSGDYQATDTLTLGLSGYALNSEGDFDEFGGDGLPPFDEINTTKTRALRVFGELQTGAVQHTFSASTFKNDRISSSNGFATAFLGERHRVDYTGVYQKSETVTYSFGADWERESFNSGADQGETDNAGLFGEVLYAPNNDLDLAFSVRYDDHSTFGGNLSGRLAAAYRVGAATTLRAVAATGYRAPSLYELNSTFYGNSGLQPEENASFELGVEHQLGGGSFVKATGFYTEIDNLIQFVTLTSWPLPFTGQYQQVAGTSTSQGIELSGQWMLNDAWALFGNYTYTDAKDANGARLLRVPEHDLVLGVDGEFAADWTANLSLRHVADRPTEFGTVMADYTVVNAALSYDLTDNATAYLRIENLLDEDYQTSANFTASGRALYVGLRANF